MKKIKVILMSIITLITLTGCFKRDHMDNITIYTTTYPVQYLVDNIYGYNSEVYSIYPLGVNPKEYELTKKQEKDYAKNDMFVYSGLTDEKQIAAAFLNNNDNLKLIDITRGVSVKRDVEELWLCPSNYLMLAQNVKNELLKYTNSTVLKQEIEDKYEDIKLTISKYDAELKLVAENAENKNIIAGNDVFEFLEKYGFNVLSIEDNDLFLQADYQEAKNLIAAKKNTYIFLLNTDSVTENVKKLQSEGAQIIYINSMINLSEKEAEEHQDYAKMMLNFIEQIKTEVY